MNAARRLLKSSLFFVLACLAGPDESWAQAISFPQNQEEDHIRDELNRVITEDPAGSANATKALNALDLPVSSPAGREVRGRRERGARRIVNGMPTGAYSAVGAVLKGQDRGTARMWCTGTLVGCDKVLTAAHCIASDPSPSSYQVFFQELGFFAVKAVDWPEKAYKFPYFDLAILTLAKPVEGIAPMPLNWASKPLNNSIATIVGFGRTGGSRRDYGIKREGTVRTQSCTGPYAKMPLVCWKFDADAIWRASAQNTCNGDSGGSIFMRDNDGNRIVEKVFGIVSGGRDADCTRKDLSFNVDVSQFRSWIEKVGDGRLSSAMCGGRPYSRSAPQRATFTLDATNTHVALSMAVPAGLQELRVSINAEDDGTGANGFDLELFDGDAAYRSPDVCEGSAQFSSCAVIKPRAGPWVINVKRVRGNGLVQVTAVVHR